MNESLNKVEFFSIGIVTFGILLKTFHLPGAGPLMIISFNILAFLYLAKSKYSASDASSKLVRMVSYMCYLAFSTGLMGILFKLQSWPGARVMLLISSVGLMISIVLLFFQNKFSDVESKKYFEGLLFRAVPIFILCSTLYLTPQRILINFFHRDDPEYAKLLIQENEHPDNPEFTKQKEEYLQQKRNKQ